MNRAPRLLLFAALLLATACSGSPAGSSSSGGASTGSTAASTSSTGGSSASSTTSSGATSGSGTSTGSSTTGSGASSSGSTGLPLGGVQLSGSLQFAATFAYAREELLLSDGGPDPSSVSIYLLDPSNVPAAGSCPRPDGGLVFSHAAELSVMSRDETPLRAQTYDFGVNTDVAYLYWDGGTSDGAGTPTVFTTGLVGSVDFVNVTASAFEGVFTATSFTNTDGGLQSTDATLGGSFNAPLCP